MFFYKKHRIKFLYYKKLKKIAIYALKNLKTHNRIFKISYYHIKRRNLRKSEILFCSLIRLVKLAT